jgi:release factor glutamine methyltransferase
VRPETVSGALGRYGARLADAGVPQARLDARLLVQFALGISHEELLASPGRRLTESELGRIDRLIDRRAAREPVSRIAGEREFYGRAFAVTPGTLDPRPDTETLVETALEIARQRLHHVAAPRLADLGTGSGAVAVSLISELPQWTGVATDVSAAALGGANANALRHKVTSRLAFIRTIWLDSVPGRFDLIVANPPYIPSAEIDGLAPEVAAFEPRVALDGGADGLRAYRELAAGIGKSLDSRGFLCLEIGAGQADGVREIMEAGGFSPAGESLHVRRDLAGVARVLTFTVSATACTEAAEISWKLDGNRLGSSTG